MQVQRFFLWNAVQIARMRGSGEVSEWLKEHAWKVCRRLNPASGVRIPLSPPDFAPAKVHFYGDPVGPSRR
jgi:hypothetical protein